MASLFALTTSALVALYAAWSGWFVLENLRDDMRAFIAHEIEELTLNLGKTDGSPGAAQEVLRNLLLVTDEPPCAFRVRTTGGEVIAQGGDRMLLLAAGGPIPVEPGDGRFRLLDKIAVEAMPVAGRPLVGELVVDLSPALQQLGNYLLAALLAFLGAVALAGLAGWFTATRGLRSLRQVVRQAEALDPVAQGAEIQLDDAPSEIREVGRALNAMLLRIHRGLRDMRTFTASLAHELRSPLQNLLGEIEVTLMAPRTLREYERVMRSNLEDLADLSDAIDNLVAWCRSTEPAMGSHRRESFDLAAEAELRLERERRTAEREGIELVLTSEGNTRIIADREGALRVLRNLVRNALHWSPAGSTVRVAISSEEGGVRVTVEDEGPGVPLELASRIFEPFVSGRRADDGRGGYGLGLAICRSVMDDHKGGLRFEPREGGGTRFIAEFPARARAA